MARGGLSLGGGQKRRDTQKKHEGFEPRKAGVESSKTFVLRGEDTWGAKKGWPYGKKTKNKKHLNPQQDRVFLNSEREIDVEKSVGIGNPWLLSLHYCTLVFSCISVEKEPSSSPQIL